MTAIDFLIICGLIIAAPIALMVVLQLVGIIVYLITQVIVLFMTLCEKIEDACSSTKEK